MDIRWARASRKHGVGRRHALWVMNHAQPVVGWRDSGEVELLWVGPTEEGWELAVIAVVLDIGDTVMVIHVQPIYRGRTTS